MKTIIATLHDHPKLVSAVGAVSGWFSAGNIARARDIAQFGAAMLAAAVTLCSLILVLPKAIAEVKRWLRKSP